jgi:hypothetical protein
VSTKYKHWLQPLLLAMHMAWRLPSVGHRYFVHMFALFTLAAGSVGHVDNHTYREMATTPYINDSHISNATDLAIVEGQLLQELHGHVPQMPSEYLPFLTLPPTAHVTVAFLLGSAEFCTSQGFTPADIFTFCSTDTVPDLLQDWVTLKLAPTL